LNEALSWPTESANLRSAWVEELNSVSSKGVFSVVNLPSGAVAIPSMWVFVYKVTPSGTIKRFKSRLAAKGCAQKPGVDFKETWAPTGSLTVLRCLSAYVAACNYIIIQADIRTAFLNESLDMVIYLAQPPRFSDGTNGVWKLHKAL
jgi:hypothetical protein